MMEQQDALAKLLSSELSLELSAGLSLEELRARLAAHINRMIRENPSRLFAILYRVDVSEKQVREVLRGPQSDSGLLIAELVIRRQLQKLESRKNYGKKQKGGDESW